MSMKERLSRLALKVVAILSSVTIIITVEPYIKFSGQFEIEFGRDRADVQSLHNSEQAPEAPAMLRIE